MSEREVKARVKLLMISMGLRPDRRGFVLIAEAITIQATKGLSMKSVYERLSKKWNQTRGCLERSMRLCINDLNVQDERAYRLSCCDRKHEAEL